MAKTAVITGITGQDGAYLAAFLLEKGYRVVGGYRRTSSVNFWRLNYLGIEKHPDLELTEYDLTDQSSAISLIQRFRPDEVYNLAAQSYVGVSFDQPFTTLDITGRGPVCLLEAIRMIHRDARFYQASTSEMFGRVQSMPQNEKTPYYPCSPYGAAKMYAHWMTVNYRESYGLFAADGILFNHESPLRGMEFVTRKISAGAAQIHEGKAECLTLGNLSAKRDWGYAGDYVQGMWQILQTDHPDTFVLATGKTITVRDFTQMAFRAIGVELEWHGSGEKEQGVCGKTGVVRIRVDPQFFRPTEVDVLLGSPVKAEKELGWKPKVGLEELCRMMVEADVERVRNNSLF